MYDSPAARSFPSTSTWEHIQEIRRIKTAALCPEIQSKWLREKCTSLREMTHFKHYLQMQSNQLRYFPCKAEYRGDKQKLSEPLHFAHTQPLVAHSPNLAAKLPSSSFNASYVQSLPTHASLVCILFCVSDKSIAPVLTAQSHKHVRMSMQRMCFS